MARKQPVKAPAPVAETVPSAEAVAAVIAPSVPKGLPPQDRLFNVWAVLADPVQCAAEVAEGAHDERLAILEHVAKSQGITSVWNAACARIEALTT